jgi:hypothetical protein
MRSPGSQSFVPIGVLDIHGLASPCIQRLFNPCPEVLRGKAAFLSAQPRHAKTCLSPGKAASREEGEAYRGGTLSPSSKENAAGGPFGKIQGMIVQRSNLVSFPLHTEVG